MQIEAPFVYSPRLALAARMRLPAGAVRLSDSFVVHIDEVSAEDAPVSLRWRGEEGAETTLRRHDGDLYEPLVVEGADGPCSIDSLQDLVEAGYSPARDSLAGRNLLTRTRELENAAAWERSLSTLRSPIVDNGDYCREQALAAARWERMGLVSIDGAVWQRADEPVLVLRADAGTPRVIATNPDSHLARRTERRFTFPLSRAADAAMASTMSIERTEELDRALAPTP